MTLPVIVSNFRFGLVLCFKCFFTMWTTFKGQLISECLLGVINQQSKNPFLDVNNMIIYGLLDFMI